MLPHPLPDISSLDTIPNGRIRFYPGTNLLHANDIPVNSRASCRAVSTVSVYAHNVAKQLALPVNLLRIPAVQNFHLPLIRVRNVEDLMVQESDPEGHVFGTTGDARRADERQERFLVMLGSQRRLFPINLLQRKSVAAAVSQICGLSSIANRNHCGGHHWNLTMGGPLKPDTMTLGRFVGQMLGLCA